MLQLNHTDKATAEDEKNNLVYWAELFKASTWEEFKALARNNPAIEEVGNMILELNTDNQTKELLEGQRRYREQMASQYTAGYTDAEEKYESIITDMQAVIDANNDTIAANQSLIAELQAKLSQYEKQ